MGSHKVFGLMAAFLSLTWAMAWAEPDSGIPPMLETQRPLAHPSVLASPQPAPPPSASGPQSRPNRPKGTKIQKRKKPGTIAASPQKGVKPEKKRRLNAKPRPKAPWQRT